MIKTDERKLTKVKLGDICNVVSGSTPSTIVKKYWGEGYSLITPLDLSKRHKYLGKIEFKGRGITTEGFSSCSTVDIPKDSVVMSSRAPIGYLTINKLDKATTNQGCKSFIIKDKNKVDSEFLYYRIARDINKIKRLGSGSTFLEVARKDLEKIEISLPSIPEQKNIAQILSKVDEDIEKADRIIQETKKLKSGLMQELLIKGIGHKKFKTTRLGMIPDEWEILEMKKIADVKAGIGFPIKYQGNKTGEVPFYKVSDMNLIGNEKYIRIANNYADSDLVKKIKANVFPKGCIIYPKVGAALLGNKRRILTQESLVDNNVGVLIPNSNVINEYLYYLMLRVDMAQFSGNGVLPAVNASTIGNILVRLPRINEQKIIVSILNSVDEKININKNIKSKLEILKKGLMQDLLK